MAALSHQPSVEQYVERGLDVSFKLAVSYSMTIGTTPN